jgi:hypothetical protein
MIGMWYKFVLEIAERALADPSTELSDRYSVKQGAELLVQAQMLRQQDPAASPRAMEMAIEGTFWIIACTTFTDSMRDFFHSKKFSGILSGLSRRAEAEEGWLPHALELAVDIQAEAPGISQADLEKAIPSRWRLKIHCPKSQLRKAISRWVREGKLAKRNR